MEISLSNLLATKRRTPKRLGRGNGSGKGTYSGRGIKGQKSRTGGKKKLKRRGLKQFLMQIPKSRGFKSMYSSFQAVNIKTLENKFNSGDLVHINILLTKGLIRTKKIKVKILGHGKISKKLNIWAHSFSKTAENAIKKAGGTVNIIKEEKKPVVEKSKKYKK